MAGVIIGVGIDVVPVERFAASLARTPGLRDRLFTATEQRTQRAAGGLATVCRRLPGRACGVRVVSLGGAGNTGGDVLYAAAAPAARGARAPAAPLAPDRADPGGLAALRGAGGRVAAGGAA